MDTSKEITKKSGSLVAAVSQKLAVHRCRHGRVPSYSLELRGSDFRRPQRRFGFESKELSRRRYNWEEHA